MFLRRFAVERLNFLPPRVLIATGLVLIALQPYLAEGYVPSRHHELRRSRFL